VQTVLYQTDIKALWRLFHGLKAAARAAVRAGAVGTVEWAIGDSSPNPAIAQSDADVMSGQSDGALSDITYEFFGANLGSSGGQNRLSENGTHDLVLVLNPDTYPAPNAFTELVRALDEPGVGVVEARQIPLEHPREYDPESGDTSWASGSCMLIRRSLFDELGGFDSEHFLLHCDDVDLSWRARRAGHRVVTAPRASVFHDKRLTFGEQWSPPEHEVYHAALGRLMLARRWGREDIVAETVEAIEAGDSETQRAALDEFQSRAGAGRVPAPLSEPGDVPAFIAGEYAAHRF
jgi:GT2 family glycosyltransferase